MKNKTVSQRILDAITKYGNSRIEDDGNTAEAFENVIALIRESYIVQPSSCGVINLLPLPAVYIEDGIGHYQYRYPAYEHTFTITQMQDYARDNVAAQIRLLTLDKCSD